ncbi:MAG: universal stress protein [Deltaproteobacteria bacterium]|nr:universal stress protein [Deltaproteobacteria bacterium]
MEYREIYVPLDNSPYSNTAGLIAVDIARKYHCRVFGSHVFSVGFCDQRFQKFDCDSVSSGSGVDKVKVPAESELALINREISRITDTYFSVLSEYCKKERVQFEAVSLQGEIWKSLVEDIESKGCDLVVMGGFGSGKKTDSILGSVASRLARNLRRDILMVRNARLEHHNSQIVVGLDGSEFSWGCFKRALELAEIFDKELIVLGVEDPNYHFSILNSINRVFDMKRDPFGILEHELVYDESTTHGLAEVFNDLFSTAKREARMQNRAIKTVLMRGRAWNCILDYVRDNPVWMLILGRTGFHNQGDGEIGSTAESLIYQTPCNLLLSVAVFHPKQDFKNHRVRWDKSAKRKLSLVHHSLQGLSLNAVHQLAFQRDLKVITDDVFDEAVRAILLPRFLKLMGFDPDTLLG